MAVVLANPALSASVHNNVGYWDYDLFLLLYMVLFMLLMGSNAQMLLLRR